MAWPIESQRGWGVPPVSILEPIARAVEERGGRSGFGDMIVRDIRGTRRGDRREAITEAMNDIDAEIRNYVFGNSNMRFVVPDYPGWLLERNSSGSFVNPAGALITSLEQCAELLGEELVTAESLKHGATGVPWSIQRYKILNLLYRRRYTYNSQFLTDAENITSLSGSAWGSSTEGATAQSVYQAAIGDARERTMHFRSISTNSFSAGAWDTIYESFVETARWNYAILHDNVKDMPGEHKLVVYAGISDGYGNAEFNGDGIYSRGWNVMPVDGIELFDGNAGFTPAFGTLEFMPYAVGPGGESKTVGYEIEAQYVEKIHDYEYLDLE